MNSNTVLQKPFLKWVGGKSQHIHQIINSFPDNMENYHEIFLGGGSVLFAILSLQKQHKTSIVGKIRAYDLNKNLINIYKAIQRKKEEFYIHLMKSLDWIK